MFSIDEKGNSTELKGKDLFEVGISFSSIKEYNGSEKKGQQFIKKGQCPIGKDLKSIWEVLIDVEGISTLLKEEDRSEKE